MWHLMTLMFLVCHQESFSYQDDSGDGSGSKEKPECETGEWSDWGPCVRSPACPRDTGKPIGRSFSMTATRGFDQGRMNMMKISKIKQKMFDPCYFWCEKHYRDSISGYVPCENGLSDIYLCRNVGLLSYLNIKDLTGGVELKDGGECDGNDIWGWTDPKTGDEYVIMGTTHGTSFVRITDPENPVVLGFLHTRTHRSIWRDIKVVNDFAFIGSEAWNHGMQIFDLTRLRNMDKFSVLKSDLDYLGLGNTHNVVANNETGYIYLVGDKQLSYKDRCRGGLHMINVQNPLDPKFEGCYDDDGYTHDAQCVIYRGPDRDYYGREICFNYNEDSLTIVDVTSKERPSIVSKIGYEGHQYTHQWHLMTLMFLVCHQESFSYQDDSGDGSGSKEKPECETGEWSDWGPCVRSPACPRDTGKPIGRSFSMTATRGFDQGRMNMMKISKIKQKMFDPCYFWCEKHYRDSISGYVPCENGLSDIYLCRNVGLLSYLNIKDLTGGVELKDGGECDGNDIWGWTDPKTGDEYVIMGTTHGTSFVRITDPENPVVLGFLHTRTHRSIWRDIKVVNDFVFIGSEAWNHGMQIFDLTRLRNMDKFSVLKSDLDYLGLGNTHNVVANNETGYIYLVGDKQLSYKDRCRGGLHMINVQNPLDPKFEGCYDDDGYTHDAQCVIYRGPDRDYYGREICFNYNEDSLTIVDVTSKERPSIVSKIGYEGHQYTHQWHLMTLMFLVCHQESFSYQDDSGDGSGSKEKPECETGEWSDWGPCVRSPACPRDTGKPIGRSFSMTATRGFDQGRMNMMKISKIKQKMFDPCYFWCEKHYRDSISGYVPCENGLSDIYLCRNVGLLSYLNIKDLTGGVELKDGGECDGNDIWGWTDPKTGDEYVIMGTTHGTSFVRITDPENPVVLGFLHTRTHRSIWRDIKVVNDFVFIGSEAWNHGMQIFDLTRLRNMDKFSVLKSDLDYLGLGNTHNVVANNETGYIYLVGDKQLSYKDRCRGGLHMINVQNPLDPKFEGCYDDDGYTHDAQCVIYRGPDRDYYGREICFNYNEDSLTIVDVTSKERPSIVSKIGYEGHQYTHQV